MKRIKILLILIVFSTSVWNCNVNDNQEPAYEFPDDVVKSAVYSGPKYPSDFFQEDLSNVILNYIQQWDIPASYEPAADDYVTAVNFVNTRLDELGLDKSKLIEGQSTEKYFEYTWSADSVTNNPQYIFRVHKKSCFEGVKFGTLDDNFCRIVELGKINYRPLSLQFVRTFFDQLWFYNHYNISGSVVLKRDASENINGCKYIIYYTMSVFGDYGLQDNIYVYKGEFEVDKSSGVSQINYTFIKQVKGNRN